MNKEGERWWDILDEAERHLKNAKCAVEDDDFDVATTDIRPINHELKDAIEALQYVRAEMRDEKKAAKNA